MTRFFHFSENRKRHCVKSVRSYSSLHFNEGLAKNSSFPVKRNYTQILWKKTRGKGGSVNFYYTTMNIKNDSHYKANTPWENCPGKENNIMMLGNL